MPPKRKPRTIDEYLAGVEPEKRAALQKLRKTIHAIIPRGEECISYQIPAFRLDGKVVVWFHAAKRHCSFFPGGIAEEFQGELENFEVSKGTVRFTPDNPLPATLVRKLIQARVQRTATATGKK